MRSVRFFAFALFFLPCFAWLGCEWATERTPVPREQTWGAEIFVSVRGQGSIVSTEPGIRCPDLCYTRIVSNLAAEAAPRSITLRVTPDPGFRFARWEVDGARVPGQGPGPSECNPVRRPAQTPDLGSAAEVTLPFGEIDGYPPPGMSEKCVDHSRVPVAYNLTAVFESDATGTPNDVWARVSPTDIVQDLLVTSSRVVARVVDGATGQWGVVLVDRESPTTQTALRLQIDAFLYDLTHHVVWQEDFGGRIGLVNRDTAQVAVWSPTPSNLRCRALTSTAQHVYCRTADQQIVRWSLDGTNQTTIATGLPSGNAMTTNGTSLFLVEDGPSTGSSSIRRLTLPGSVDAGAPVLEVLAGTLTTPRSLRADAAFAYALVDSAGGGVVRVPLFGSAAASYTIGDSGLLYAPEPPAGDPRLWVANTGPSFAWEITSRSRVNVPKAFRVGLKRVTGLAIDDAYVYWTQDDARVFRGRK